MKSQPYKPHIIRHSSHRDTSRNNLSLMMQNPNLGWDFHVPLDRRMAEPNVSSAIHPCAIFQAWMWDLIEHINQNSSRASKGYPPQLIKQWFHLTVEHHKTNIKSVSTPAFQGSRVFVPTWIPGLVTQAMAVTGHQSVCPTKDPGLVTQPTTIVRLP